jgi:hypothetical protein
LDEDLVRVVAMQNISGPNLGSTVPYGDLQYKRVLLVHFPNGDRIGLEGIPKPFGKGIQYVSTPHLAGKDFGQRQGMGLEPLATHDLRIEEGGRSSPY